MCVCVCVRARARVCVCITPFLTITCFVVHYWKVNVIIIMCISAAVFETQKSLVFV